MELKRKQRKRSTAGFTLTEVMFGSFLMAMVLGISLQTLSTAIKRIRTANNQMQAMHFARNHMESLRILPYEDDQLSAGVHPITLPSGDDITDHVTSASYLVAVESLTLKNISITANYENLVTGSTTPATVTTTFAKPLH